MNQKYLTGNHVVELDFIGASFFLASFDVWSNVFEVAFFFLHVDAGQCRFIG